MENSIQASGFVIQPRLQFDNLKDKMLYQHFMNEANYIESSACQIGQLITSIKSIENETGWSYGVVRGVLGRLEDKGFIRVEAMSQKRGIKVTMMEYSRFQSLKTYEKINKEDNNPITKRKQSSNKEDNNESEATKPDVPTDEGGSKMPSNKEDNNPITNQKQSINNEINNTITALITSLNSTNSNITLKDFLASSKVKSMNLTSTDDIKIFVDFALLTNAFPEGTSRKILIAYFDAIRLTRSTCNISANLLAKQIEKMGKYSVNQINYALWMHCEKHDDKKEQYTLGILRNTKEPEARRGLMMLKNKNGGVEDVAANGTSTPRNDAVQSKIDAANERRKRIAGIESNRDIDVPF